jgi:hypothetical protein
MTEKTLKALTGIFGTALVALAVSLGMTIYTGVKDSNEKANPPPISIPTPAMQ